MPILIVSSARAAKELSAIAPPTKAPAARNTKRLVTDIVYPDFRSQPRRRRAKARTPARSRDASAMPIVTVRIAGGAAAGRRNARQNAHLLIAMVIQAPLKKSA